MLAASMGPVPVTAFVDTLVADLASRLPDGCSLYKGVAFPRGPQGGQLPFDALLVSPGGVAAITALEWTGHIRTHRADSWQLTRTSAAGKLEQKTIQHLDWEASMSARSLNTLLRRCAPDVWRPEDRTIACVVCPDGAAIDLKTDLAYVLRASDLIGFLVGKSQAADFTAATVKSLAERLEEQFVRTAPAEGTAYRDRFQLKRRLWQTENKGLGYTAEAHLASDRDLEGKEVQVTIFRLAPQAGQPGQWQRTWEHLKKTQRAVLRLHHPAVPGFLDRGEVGNTEVWISLNPPRAVTHGFSLAEHFANFREHRQAPSMRWIRSVFSQLLDALDHAHENGVYHRALNPANIFIADDHGKLQVGISDFGSARIDGVGTQYAGFTRSPYTAPELLGDRRFGPDTAAADFIKMDVYSVGALLIEALTLMNLDPYLRQHYVLTSLQPSDDFTAYGGLAKAAPELALFWDPQLVDLRSMVATDPAVRYAAFDSLRNVLEVIS